MAGEFAGPDLFRAARAHGEHDVARRFRPGEAAEREAGRRRPLVRHGEFRQQRDAEAFRHQPRERGQRRRAEVDPGPPRQPADRQRLVGEAVSLVEQQQGLAPHRLGPGAARQAVGMTVGDGVEEAVLDQAQRLDPRLVDRGRDDGGVEPPLAERGQQRRRLRLGHPDVERHVVGAEPRQRARQEVGRDGRDQPQRQPPRQPAAEPDGAFEIADLGQDPPRALQHLGARPRQADAARQAFDERGMESRLELLHLLAEGGLADVHPLRRRAESAFFREGDKVRELSERYGHKAGLWRTPENTTGNHRGRSRLILRTPERRPTWPTDRN